MSKTTAKIIEDSISEDGVRLTTMQLTYPRIVHAELMTHRVFSRNASSSRAIPVMKMLSQVWNDPAEPAHWGQNQAGMQARHELSPVKKWLVRALWRLSAKAVCLPVYLMHKLGAHKQVANRLLEPFQYIHVVVTSTEWENFYLLRDHEAADPTIHALAKTMHKAHSESTPRKLGLGSWHLPYVSEAERAELPVEILRKLSSARCARASYMKHDGTSSSVDEDVELYSQLVVRPYVDKRGFNYTMNDPIHASPTEHQACPSMHPDKWSGNFRGWMQHRKMIESTFAAND